MNWKQIREVIKTCLIQHFEADFLLKVSLKIIYATLHSANSDQFWGYIESMQRFTRPTQISFEGTLNLCNASLGQLRSVLRILKPCNASLGQLRSVLRVHWIYATLHSANSDQFWGYIESMQRFTRPTQISFEGTLKPCNASLGQLRSVLRVHWILATLHSVNSDQFWGYWIHATQIRFEDTLNLCNASLGQLRSVLRILKPCNASLGQLRSVLRIHWIYATLHSVNSDQFWGYIESLQHFTRSTQIRFEGTLNLCNAILGQLWSVLRVLRVHWINTTLHLVPLFVDIFTKLEAWSWYHLYIFKTSILLYSSIWKHCTGFEDQTSCACGLLRTPLSFDPCSVCLEATSSFWCGKAHLYPGCQLLWDEGRDNVVLSFDLADQQVIALRFNVSVAMAHFLQKF